MKYRFFKPYVGDFYDQGINGKRILVVGASFYCSRQECIYFSECTSTELKNSSIYDEICPVYKRYEKVLRNEPTYSVEDGPKTYRRFSETIKKITGAPSYEDSWRYVAFTNYVQFFLPSNGLNFRSTKPADLSQRDFDAFIETVEELKPDIIVIWGCVINYPIKETNQYIIDRQMLLETNGYVCYMKYPNRETNVAIINSYHPSSSSWYSCKNDFEFYLNKLINE